MIIYLSGPMTGYDFFNFPAFDAAKEVLQADGHMVISPPDISRGLDLCEHDGTAIDSFTEEDYQRCMRKDIETILFCDAMFVLPGWKQSRGAKLEVAIALVLGIPVFDFYSMEQLSADCKIHMEVQG